MPGTLFRLWDLDDPVDGVVGELWIARERSGMTSAETGHEYGEIIRRL